MAIVLGTNGYISVDDFKSWADARGYDYLPYDNFKIENAITISSVDFLDVNYQFKGKPLDESQAMQLPTKDVTIADILNGAAQAAWLQLTGNLLIDPSTVDTRELIEEEKKVGPLSTMKKYREGSTLSYAKPSSSLDRMLSKYVVGGGGLRVLRG